METPKAFLYIYIHINIYEENLLQNFFSGCAVGLLSVLIVYNASCIFVFINHYCALLYTFLCFVAFT